mmetsp:Transcript_55170/g.89423  ORF Transcript_55170/g.89423 Transcript_55170/m.89423 type:complete len:131 (+) Transcript_55170:27-419(+)
MTIVGYLTYPLVHKMLTFHAGVKSFRAIQSPDPTDDKQWLTFWLLFGLFDLICFVTGILGFLIPFYDEAKVGFLIFMGAFGGAHKIYPILEPFLLQGDEVAKKYEPLLEQHAKRLRDMAEAKAKELGKHE